MANVFYKWIYRLILPVVVLALTGAMPVEKGAAVIKNTFRHPFYMSTTEINHNSAEKTLEISCKLFIEDFEKALAAVYKMPVDLSNPKDKKQVDQWVFNYLQKHIQLKVDGKPVVLQFVGYEKEKEAAWCYVQVNNVPTVKKIEIVDTLLYEQFESQINVLHVTVGGNRKSTRLNNPDALAVFTF
jgi:hypothetical protein